MQREAEAATHDASSDEAASSSSDGGDESEAEEEQGGSQAAGYTLDLGSAPGGDGKFRDENFYLGYDRGDNRYAEEGFAVGGRGEDMVLDLAGDENVSLPVARVLICRPSQKLATGLICRPGQNIAACACRE